MRIAVVNDTVYPFFKGGAQKRVYEISRRLVQRGHDICWYCMDYGATEVSGIKLRAVSPAYELYNEEGKRRIRQALGFAARLHIKGSVDVIDCMNFPYLHCFRAKESALRLHVPLIITWFEFWGNYWYRYTGRIGVAGKTVEKIVTYLPNLIIADSEKVRLQLVGSGVRDGKIKVVHDGVDTKLIAQVEPSKKKYDVVYVGRVLPHKNVDVLVKALARMDSVTAVIIGSGNDYRRCEALSEELGLTKRVEFLGHMPEDEDVYAIIKSAKVLVLPSTQEGHPLVLPEAHACGTPTIGIKGVCDEFIEHGRTGYLSALDERSLGDAIGDCLNLYPKFKEACLIESAKYDWETITDKVEAVYKELT